MIEHTSEGDSDNIVTQKNSGDGVSLNRCRRLVAAETDVVADDRVEACIIELDRC